MLPMKVGLLVATQKVLPQKNGSRCTPVFHWGLLRFDLNVSIFPILLRKFASVSLSDVHCGHSEWGRSPKAIERRGGEPKMANRPALSITWRVWRVILPGLLKPRLPHGRRVLTTKNGLIAGILHQECFREARGAGMPSVSRKPDDGVDFSVQKYFNQKVVG